MTAPEPASLRARRGLTAALVSRIGGRIMGLAFIVYLAREESTATFAAYSYLLVLAATLGVLSDSGIGAVVSREVASARSDVATAYRAGFPVAVASAVLAAIGVAAVGLVDNGPGSGGAALLFATMFVAANVLFGYQAEIMRASGRQVREAFLQITAGVLQVGLGIVVIRSGGGLALLMAVLAGKEVLVSLLSQLSLPAPWRGTSDRVWRRRLLRSGLWLGVASTAIAVTTRIGQVALSNAGDLRSIADYAAGARVLDVTLLLGWTVGLGLFPWMAQTAAHAGERFGATMVRGLTVAAAATCAACVLLLPLIGPAVRLVFGSDYRGAVEPASVLLLSTPMLLLLFLSWNGLVALGSERTVGLGAVAGAGLTTVACGSVLVSPSPLLTALVTMAGVACMTIVLVTSLVRRIVTRPAGVDAGATAHG